VISLRVLWRNLFQKGKVECDLSEEVASYADLLTEKISRDVVPSVARRQTLLEIGGIEQVKEQVREVRAGNSLDALLKDVRHAVRSVRHSAGTSALAIGTLGIGLGATTLIFSVFYSVLLQPLPFRNSEQLVQLWETRAGQGWDQASFSTPNYWDVRAQNTTFESMAAMLSSDMNMTGNGDPQHLSVAFVSAQFFHVLGVSPLLGHDFEPLQDQPGHDGAVALLSSKLWSTRFASSRNVLGTTLHFDGRPYIVIGVLPQGEPWLNGTDVFLPMVYTPGKNRGNFEASVIGRLAPNVSISVAHDDLQRIARRLSEAYPADRGMGIRISPSEVWGARPVLRRALYVLLGAVALLLLIACVNIANLLLAKASVRSRELRIREALGASRWHIIRLVLSESLVLGGLGAAVGLLIAWWGTAVLRSSELTGIPRLAEVSINGWVLGFALVAMLLAGIVSGLAPAIQSSSGNITAMLRDGDRTQTAGRGQNRIRSLLVATEVALSMMLLVGACLLIRSFGKVLAVDRGFETANRVIAVVNIPFNYDDARAKSISRTLLDRLRALPGIKAVGTVNSRPIVGWDPGMGFGASDSVRSTSGDVPWASWRLVSTGYFQAMGIRLLEGRSFTDGDISATGTRHVIVSKAVADHLWPGKDPIGRNIILWKGQSNHAAEVIGVVASTRDHGLDLDPIRTVYIPFYGQTNSPVQLIIHSASSPGQIASLLRSTMAAIDPKVPVSDVQTMDELVNHSLGSKQLHTALLSMFAVIALLLSMSGIYGVLAYFVARRTSEIGIRLALGADRITIFRLVLRQGLKPVVAGMVIGAAGSLAIMRLLAALLFEVRPADAISYSAVTLVIGVTALISCLLPARRALGVDPAAALRQN
jgi:predicted permease